MNKRVTIEGNKIIFEKTPPAFGLWTYLFILGGIALLSFSIYGYFYMSDANLPEWAAVGLAFLSLILILEPFFERQYASFLVIDCSLRKVSIKEKSIFRSSLKEYDFSVIRKFQVKQDTSPDNPEGWYLAFELANGESFEIINSFNREQKPLEDIAQTVNAILLNS